MTDSATDSTATGSTATGSTVELPVEIDRIQALLPHRYPFLLVDRLIEFEAGRRAVAIKNVTVNEPYFNGHFPGRPVMPGVLLIEAMAQTAGLLTQLTRVVSPPGSQAPIGRVFYLAKIENARFLRSVGPGDQLTLEARLVREIRHIARYDCYARIGAEPVAEARITCADMSRQ